VALVWCGAEFATGEVVPPLGGIGQQNQLAGSGQLQKRSAADWHSGLSAVGRVARAETREPWGHVRVAEGSPTGPGRARPPGTGAWSGRCSACAWIGIGGLPAWPDAVSAPRGDSRAGADRRSAGPSAHPAFRGRSLVTGRGRRSQAEAASPLRTHMRSRSAVRHVTRFACDRFSQGTTLNWVVGSEPSAAAAATPSDFSTRAPERRSSQSPGSR
jgi:hypothetical protein